MKGDYNEGAVMKRKRLLISIMLIMGGVLLVLISACISRLDNLTTIIYSCNGVPGNTIVSNKDVPSERLNLQVRGCTIIREERRGE